MSSCAFIGLGANLGRRAEQIRQAIELLSRSGVDVMRCSSIYESAPVGPISAQPDFLNAVIEVRGVEQPLELLLSCQSVEDQLGRERSLPLGPRCIDLDVLLVGAHVIATTRLTLPHPQLTDRGFVLVPLLELQPDLVDPRDALPLSRHIERVCRTQVVRKVLPPVACGAAR